MRVACLFSGGKDSCYALYQALSLGWEVVTLVSVQPRKPESWMFHYPATDWCWLQSEALELPLVIVDSSGMKEKELNDLKEVLVDLKSFLRIEGLVSGAVESNYQKTRLDRLCGDIGVKGLAPLWHMDPVSLVRAEIDAGFEIVITFCGALGLTKEWIGRKLDLKCLEEIIELNKKYGVHPAFEGGEAETFVLDGPMFKKIIQILKSKAVWENDSGQLIIEEASLKPK